MSKRERFIAAYCWYYGSTKKRATEIYKKTDDEYIDLIIKSFEAQSRIAFYED